MYFKSRLTNAGSFYGGPGSYRFLEIPVLSLELFVLEQCDANSMKTILGCYSGTPDNEGFVVCGHNYKEIDFYKVRECEWILYPNVLLKNMYKMENAILQNLPIVLPQVHVRIYHKCCAQPNICDERIAVKSQNAGPALSSHMVRSTGSAFFAVFRITKCVERNLTNFIKRGVF